MTTATFVCSACTTGSIASLSTHRNATDAMTAFLKKMLLPGTNRFSVSPKKFEKLDSFWVFTCGPEGGYYGWKNYATDFAKFIEDNKLGDITTLPKRLNAKYHPTTTCQTWLWGPDQKACEAWYRTNVLKEGLPGEGCAVEAVGKASRRDGVEHSTRCPSCRRIYGNHDGWQCPNGYGEWPE